MCKYSPSPSSVVPLELDGKNGEFFGMEIGQWNPPAGTMAREGSRPKLDPRPLNGHKDTTSYR